MGYHHPSTSAAVWRRLACLAILPSGSAAGSSFMGSCPSSTDSTGSTDSAAALADSACLRALR